MEYFVWVAFRFGIATAFGGMLALIVLIPLLGRLKAFTSVRTEFYSARAAYWCVLAGLAMVLIMTISIAIRFSIVPAIGGR
jgi:hypothetical protein